MRGLGLCLGGVFAAATAACGGGAGPCSDLPLPMTPARARALLPGLETGLAVTTERNLGTCSDEQLAMCPSERGCGLVRRSMRLWLLPAEGSWPQAPECGVGALAEDLERRAAVAATSSGLGEGVWALEPGGYLLFFARSGTDCGRCAEGDSASCLVRIESGRVSVRVLVAL